MSELGKGFQTFGPETWAKGSSGKAGPFNPDGMAYIENLLVAHDGSLVVTHPWYRWGWHANSATYKNLIGFDQTTNLSGTNFAMIVPIRYRDQAVSPTVHRDALALVDGGGTKIFDAYIIADPLTTYFEDSTVDARGAIQFGFGFLDYTNRYSALIQGMALKSEGVGALDGSVENGRIALGSRFILSGTSFFYVGSTIHQSRAFYWGFVVDTATGTSMFSNRIWYSDPFDYVNFSEDTQWFEVDGEVRGAVSLGPNLLIWTVEGNWFVIQGRGDPSKATKHHKGQDRILPLDSQAAIYQDVAIFLSEDGYKLVVIDRDGNPDYETLARFGAEDVSTNVGRRWSVSSFPKQEVIIAPGSTLGEAYALYRGAWVNEVWSMGATAFTDRAVHRGFPEANREYLSVPVEVSAGVWEHEVYYRSALTSEPSSYVDSAGTQPASTVQGKIELPRLWHPESDIKILEVTIDVQYWKAASDPVYDDVAIEVEVEDSKGDTYPFTLGPDSTVISGLPAASPGHVRITATPTAESLPFESWSLVRIQGIQAMAIEQVTVGYEARSPDTIH